MSQDLFDHAYACGVSRHVVNQPAVDSAVSDHSENSILESFTEANLLENPAQPKKVLVESVNAADLGAIHEKLIKDSPNKSWYVNEKNSDKTNNGSVSSSTTETADSDTEAMDVDTNGTDEVDGVNRNENNETNGLNRDQNNPSISPTESAEYTPMSPIPMDEGASENGEQAGGNCLREINNGNETAESHTGKDGFEVSEKISGDAQQEVQVNGFPDHGNARYSTNADKTDNPDEETEVDGDDIEQETELNETDHQNLTQTSELNGSPDSDATWNVSVEPEADTATVSPLVIKKKGRHRGRHRRWSYRVTGSPRKRSFGSSGSVGTPTKDAGAGTDDSLLDTSTAEDTSATREKLEGVDDRQKRRSKTPSRQNPDDYLVGEKAFDDIIERKKGDVDSKILRKFPEIPEDQLEIFSEPLKHGWRREIVTRGVWDDIKSKHPPMDVYYHPPSGTGPKLRSMVGINDWLEKYGKEFALTAANFTFMRRPIGVAEGEVFRSASVQRGRASAAAAARKRGEMFDEPSPKKSRPKRQKPEIVIERDSDDVNVTSLLAAESPILTSHLMSPVSSQGVSPVIVTPVTVRSASGTPVRVVTPVRTLTPGRTVTPVRPVSRTSISGTDSHEDADAETNSGKTNAKKESKGTVTTEEIKHGGEKVEMLFPSSEAVIISPPKKKFKSTARKSTTQKYFRKPKPKYSELESLCTLNCPGLEGISPLLRCNVCMCLFHPECVNYRGDLDKGFVCLRCVDLCNTVPQDTTVVLEDGMMRVPDPTTFGSIASSSPSAVPIKMTEVTTTSALPNFSNLLSAPSSEPLPPVSSAGLDVSSSLKSPYTVRVSTPAILKSWTTTQIKQEPLDPDELEKDGRRIQASSEALGSLKNMISTRLEQNAANVNPVLQVSSQFGSWTSQPPNTHYLNGSPYTVKPNLFPRPVSLQSVSSPVYPIITGKGLQSSLPNKIDPITGLPLNMPPVIHLPVMNSTANNNILQTNSGLKLVPIGPPVKIKPGLATSLPGMAVRPPSNQSLLTSIVMSTSPAVTTTAVSRPRVSVITSLPSSSTTSSSSLSVSTQVMESPSSSKPKTFQTIINTNAVCAPKNGQLLTLPHAVVKKITPNKPLQLKINNVQLNVPPSGFFMTTDGLKVFVPPNTFPTSDVDFCFSVSDDKTNDASSNSASSDKMCDQNNDSDKGSQGSEKTEKSSSDLSKSSEATKVPEKPDFRESESYKKCCHMHKLYGGFDCMQTIFRLLNVRDLCSVGMVCRTWRMISRHPLLWKDVNFKDVKVSSWQKAVEFLTKRKVQGINLLGLLHYDDPNRTWHQLISAVSDLKTLKRITFGVVPATVLHSVCERLTQLEGLTAESISDFNNESLWNRPTKLDVGKFACLTALKDLRLKGIGGLSAPSFSFSGGLSELSMLKNLEKMSILSLRSLPETQFHFISDLTQLQELALGDCNTWTSETFFQLGKLTNLKCLRLEHGGEIPDVGLGDALVNLKQLERLELYTYTVADSLGSYLKQMPQLRTLILWPDNCFLPAEVNTNTLKAVTELTFLSQLDWAISSSCNTSIILDSNENTEQVSQNNGLQWIPFYAEKNDEDTEGCAAEKKNAKRQTEYIRLHELQENVSDSLPETRTRVYCVKPEDLP